MGDEAELARLRERHGDQWAIWRSPDGAWFATRRRTPQPGEIATYDAEDAGELEHQLTQPRPPSRPSSQAPMQGGFATPPKRPWEW